MTLSRLLYACFKVSAFVVAALSVADFVAAATPRYWSGPNGFGASGNWNTAGNWSPAGVPGSGDDTNILLNNGTGTSAAINYDYTGPAVTIGNVYINASPFPRRNPTATLNIAANTLSAGIESVGNSFVVGGTGGMGAINQSGGKNAAQGLELADGATDNGAYTLSAGTLQVYSDADNGEEDVGLGGTASFSQSGGTNSTSLVTLGTFAGANGAYTLSGGDLNSPKVIVGGRNASNPTAGGTGVFTISGTSTLTTINLTVFPTTGSSLNLSGGSIVTRALNVNGTPSLFKWTTGTLIITSDAIFEPTLNMAQSWTAFGSALSLGASQDLGLLGFEGIGGANSFSLTVGSGATHSVSELLSISSNGTVQLNGGTLSAGSIVSVGMFAINSGSLTTGDVRLNLTSTLAIGLGGTTRGSQYGALTASGHVKLTGSLVVSLNSFTPSLGQAFDVLDWEPGFLTGTFSSLQLPALAAGLAWNTSQLYTTGVLNVGVAGDYNQNGVVDAADYVVWREGLGTTYTQTDYDVWRAHFGQTAGGGAGALANAAVPEPVVSLQIILVSAVLSLRRRRGA